MAINLLELSKSAVTPDIISKLSGLLGEDTAKTRSAVKYTLPSIMLIYKCSAYGV